MSLNGTLLAIEGTDGSGKATQAQKLVERLEAEGYDVLAIDFPRYQSRSSYFVKQYLKGHYGGLDDVSPYVTALFYALDRYQAAPVIREALQQGKVVVTDRYTGSNMAHQGSKLVEAEERRALFNWIQSLEYQLLHIPKPDKSVVLYVPAGIAQDLKANETIALHGSPKLDLHETDLNHLHKANESYDEICQLMPDDFTKVDCARGNQMLGIEAIHDLIWQKVQPLLPTRGQKHLAKRYQEPEKLDADSAEHYADIMSKIFKNYDDMLTKLTEHLVGQGSPAEDARAQAIDALCTALPVAVKRLAGPSTVSTTVAQLATDNLPDNHSMTNNPVTLVTATPRNELAVVPDMVYQYSNLPFKTIQAEVDKWPVERKHQVFTAYLETKTGSALEKIRYTWDIVCDYSTFEELQRLQPTKTMEWQALTPRYGYDIPDLVEQSGLADAYEESFDLSLQLYSRLQMTDHPGDAQYATLQGHRLRWRVEYSAADILKLEAAPLSMQSKRQLSRLVDVIAQVHPTIGEYLE